LTLTLRAVAVVAALVAGGASYAESVASANGVQLRALDRLSGGLTDIDVPVGGTARYANRLLISLVECRYPENNPTGDAYAFLLIRDLLEDSVAFEGWMIASSPALNPLDHSRYDVWVLGCNRS
jgi:hypothetical protein